MARKLKDDPAIDLSKPAESEAPEDRAPLAESAVKTVEFAVENSLLSLSAKALRDEVAEDESESYHIGITSDAPFESRTVYGVSLERRRGTYDKVARSWSYEPGRIVRMSPRLAQAILDRASLRWHRVKIKRKANGTEVAVGVLESLDLHTLTPERRERKIRDLRRNRVSCDPETGVKNSEWRCERDFVMVSKRDNVSLVSADRFSLERDALLAENRRLREQNDRLLAESEGV